MAVRRRASWSQHEVQQLREAVSTHGHSAKSMRSILADADFPSLKPPAVTLQRLEDKIKNLTKQKVQWLVDSAPGLAQGGVVESPAATPGTGDTPEIGSSSTPTKKRLLAKAKCTPEKENVVQTKKANTTVQIAGRPVAPIAFSTSDAGSWAHVLQRLYFILLPAFQARNKCLDPPEGWCSSHDVLKIPLSLRNLGWHMSVDSATVQIKKILAWAIPSQAALDTIKKFSPNGVVEIGAGSGFWASLLWQHGVKVVAYDNFTWCLEITIEGDAGLQTSKIPLHFPVKFGDPSVLHKYSKQSLLIVMPPSEDESQSTMAHEALLTYAGDTVLLVGEQIMKDTQVSHRTTAGVKFCKQLEDEWEPAQTVKLPVWPEEDDRPPIELQVWQRKARDTSVVLAYGTDFACNAHHAVDNSSHTDRACLLKFFIGEFVKRMNEACRGRRCDRDAKAKNLAKQLAELLEDLTSTVGAKPAAGSADQGGAGFRFDPSELRKGSKEDAKPAAATAVSFVLGDAVKIDGLKQRADLNGLWGVCQSPPDPESGRVELVTSSGERLKVKPDSLWAIKLTSGTAVRIVGVVAKPELNGKVGRLAEFDLPSGRWLVQDVPYAGVLKLQPQNLVRVH